MDACMEKSTATRNSDAERSGSRTVGTDDRRWDEYPQITQIAQTTRSVAPSFSGA